MSYIKVKRSDLQFGAVLGRGGFSTVYQAIWTLATTRSSQKVAVKKLNTIETGELDIMSKLDHSHIVKLLGVVDEAPDFFLVLELCTGGTLRQYLDAFTMKRLPFTQFLDWMKQAVLPIQYLRDKGVVHKDIKSPNYLITDRNVLKLGDFGTAKEIDTTMSNATVTASYPWMAPELLKDLKLSPNYDIFSFGVVVWELWTTDYPHKGLEPQVIAWRVCQENQRLPIPVFCPKAIAGLMRQCWNSDWTKRPDIEHVLSIITTTAAEAESAIHQGLIGSRWKLERKIAENGLYRLVWPRGIAITHQGDVCVAEHSAAKVQVYSQQGLHKFSIHANVGLEPWTESWPTEVRVGLDGSFYITDETQFVKVYYPGREFRHKWPAISPQHRPSDAEDTCLCGLAIDAQGQLLVVGEIKLRYVSKHRQDGTHIASFRVDIQPKMVAVTSQDTIIINDGVKSAHILDSGGQLLHNIQPPNSDVPWWAPKGMTCFEGMICICNYFKKFIHCFSVSGGYLGDIPITIPGEPRSIEFTAGGKHLVVAYDNDAFSGAVAIGESWGMANDGEWRTP